MTGLERPDIGWTDAGPVSRRFGDVYFSAEGGLDESRAVFLAGCGLPEAWGGRDRFVLAETGFGTGLNILAALDLWRRTRAPGGRLHVFSVEAHPLSREEAARAHAAWPELAEVSQALLDQWPHRTPGLHRIDLPQWNAVLDVAHGEAAQMLAAWDGRADAWFLDGFAPASNPEMWRDEVLGLVASRSAPGARLATFTVAGAVRRGLTVHGFSVRKVPGFGRKRERLEADFPGGPPRSASSPRVMVIGAGIAGASLVRAFRRLGVEPTLIDEAGLGAGASGAPAALVTPRLEAGDPMLAELGAQAFHRAVRLYRREAPDAVLAQGILRLARHEKDAARLARIAALPLWPEEALRPLDPNEVDERLGEGVDRAGLLMAEALVIEPPSLLSQWLDAVPIEPGKVTEIRPGAPARIRVGDGRLLETDHVIVAAGWGSRTLGLPSLRPVRGQLAWARAASRPTPCIWGPGYAIPTREGWLVGATHDRDRDDARTDPADTIRLLAGLAEIRPDLAGRVSAAELTPRAAVRATTPDHLPLCGQVAEGVHVLSGLGGRGFAWAPLLAEHLAAGVVGLPSPLPGPLAARLDPVRFSAAGDRTNTEASRASRRPES